MSIESVMSSNHFVISCPLLLFPSIFPSIRIFSSKSTLPIRWPNYWSLSFSISPSNEYSGLISFRIDWFDFLAVLETLKGLLQHLSPKASILQHSVFFMVQLSHLYMTTGKTIALTICDSWGLRVRHNWATELTIWTFADKVMSLPFNMLSRFVILFFQSTSVF